MNENTLLTKEEVIEFLKLDEDDIEPTIIDILMKNAQYYIEDASRLIAEMSNRTREKAKLLGLVLISDWYDNRSLNMKTSEKVRYTVSNLLAQIQYCDEVE